MAQNKYNPVILDELITSKIYVIREKKVILDSDLAELYDVETRRLNEQVKRNVDRFPADFMFQLSQEEFENLKSQFATSSWGGRRKLPYAFTEQGVAMLSGVLHSDRAIKVNIDKAFYIPSHAVSGRLVSGQSGYNGKDAGFCSLVGKMYQSIHHLEPIGFAKSKIMMEIFPNFVSII